MSDRQTRIELARLLRAKRVRFAGESATGNDGYRVVAVTDDGMIELDKFGGLFAPHLFTIVGDRPLPFDETRS